MITVVCLFNACRSNTVYEYTKVQQFKNLLTSDLDPTQDVTSKPLKFRRYPKTETSLHKWRNAFEIQGKGVLNISTTNVTYVITNLNESERADLVNFYNKLWDDKYAGTTVLQR